MSGDDWETFSDDFWGDVFRLLRWWETPRLGAFALHLFLFGLSFYLNRPFRPCVFFFVFFEECVRAAIEYVSTIDDFDDLVDPRTLASHCLGPKPSHYILRAICREEKSEFL